MRPEDVVGVEVPASAANLGPGFDAFAVALGLHLVAWTDDEGPRHVVCSGHGARELPGDERNLVWRAFTAFCRHAGVDVPAVSIVTRNAIPLDVEMILPGGHRRILANLHPEGAWSVC